MKGHLADQKSVLIFQESGGESVLYNFNATGDLADIHQGLLDDGVQFHTLVPNKGGAEVFVVDMDGSAVDAVKKGAQRYGTEIEYNSGRAEFVGTDDQTGTDREQRDRARSVYEGIIDQSTVPGSQEVWAGIRDRWGETLDAALAEPRGWEAAETETENLDPPEGPLNEFEPITVEGDAPRLGAQALARVQAW